MPTVSAIQVQHNAPIPTWFKIGGGAERFVSAQSPDQLQACIELDPSLRVLGDGANLLVDDDGIPELVVRIAKPTNLRDSVAAIPRTGADAGLLHLSAGCGLPEVILDTVRSGWAGLEGLGGIPASLGGATMMNAGGAFGEIATVVHRVHAFDRQGRAVTLDRGDIPFSYRHSGLNHLIVSSVELKLTPSDPAALRTRLKEVMAYKRDSQPMAANSAGCVFKNPTLARDMPELAALGWTAAEPRAGSRVSAGFLIQHAQCKGLRVSHDSAASVSERHANFIVTGDRARAREVIDLMSLVTRRVLDRFGVQLEPEVVVWSRHQ